MGNAFRYTVEVEVVLTGEELAMLLALAAGHYDDTCRNIATGEVAWLRGEALQALPDGVDWPPFDEMGAALVKHVPEARFFASSRKLQLLMKVLEVPRPMPLRVRLYALWQAIHDEHLRVNAEAVRPSSKGD